MKKYFNLKFFYSRFRPYSPLQVIRYLFLEIRRSVWENLILGAYSQNHEDIVIDDLLGKPKKGFYVDVGASDPSRFNNTKMFYLRGWTGINIEPDKKNFKKFRSQRPRDINLNLGIGMKAGKKLFFQFIPDTLSTFSKVEASMNKKNGFKYTRSQKIKVRTLRLVFQKYLRNKKIDFLSIDTEGSDLLVLKSNDWKAFRPTIVCVETNKDSDIEKYLFSLSYRKMYSNEVNTIFKDK